MRGKAHTGFTLVELLVVIVVIAMLVALTVPAILSARARARQTTCTDRLHNLANAIHEYELAKDQLPGYVDSFGGVGNLSWVLMILPYTEHTDVWRNVRQGNLPTPPDEYAVPEFLCPVGERTDSFCPLSYVVNCGIPDGTTFDVKGVPTNEGTQFALFFNHDTVNFPNLASTRIKVKLDKIPDGQQFTLLLGENLQATYFVPIDAAGTLRPVREADVGMLFTQTPGACGSADGNVVPPNMCTTDLVPFPRDNPPVRYARPSSLHPGGFIVAYADGHAAFVGDDIDYQLYQQQMIPDDVTAGIR
ncbi:hypothetical protein JCM19992_06630 [Thermostilla marina]